MPRDNDKNNGRPPRRAGGAGAGGKGRAPGGRGSKDSRGRPGARDGERPARSSAPRGERKFGDKTFGDRKPYAGKRDDFRKDGERGASRPRFDREDRPQRSDRPDRGPRKEFGARGERGEGRTFKPREERAPRSGDRPYKPRGERSDSRSERGASTGRFGDKKFGEKRSYKPRGEGGDARPARFNREDRPQRSDRPDRGPRKEFGARSERGEGRTFKPREDRAPRRDFGRGEDRGNEKPWAKRAPRDRDDDRRDHRPAPRSGGRFDKPREDRGSAERPRFSRSREDRPERSASADRGPRKFDRPREGRETFGRPRFDKPREERASRPAHRTEWQEHPRNEGRGRFSREDRPRRDNEDDSKIFAKRPAFGGRGAYRERRPDDERRVAPAPKKDKTGERIAKIVARAGMCSRREAEEWITQGRVAVNGRVITSPALDITSHDVVTIDGKKLPERERTRLFLYHKPRGLMTTHDDPEGRPTVFDNLPEGLPRLISIGRLDFNTEGLLLLTNDGGLSRALEHPDTGWLRRYRVRAHGEVTQAQLDELKKGVEVDGVKYGPIDATLERDQGANVWVVFAIREGKNREVRNVMAHLGLEVNRLIRVSYGPFQLGEIEEGQVEEVRGRVLRDQLGDKIVAMSGAVFDKPAREVKEEAEAKKTKRAVIADRKGRRVVVQRTGSDEARERNEHESSGYGPPRRPKRGYHGKRDLTPKE
ncbi:MAG: pseudouridine synthase [Rhizobiales bacterium]|nr:pseudouridine synthase [Hyphomicrobiales bacterium]